MPTHRARLIDRVPEGALPSADAILDQFLGWVADQGLSPYAAQEEALLELMSGRHVVLSTPTGSGKSLIALALHFKAMCEGKRSFYTAPIKALVSEKFFALCAEFGAENVGMLTGDASINWAAPVICCTAEVLSNMALSQGEGADAPYVVMDEFHYYDDRDRGVAWQIPLIVLVHSQFLLLSATLGNTAAIEERIHARTGRAVAHVHADKRPVPLDYEYAETPIQETIDRLRRERKAPIYVVHFTQRGATLLAQALTSAKLTDRDEKRSIRSAIGDFRFDTPFGPTIKRILTHGIGLHHAGLLPRYRRLVERLAQAGILPVICGTDTLGVGINIPIRTVLFTQLSKYDGEKVGLLSVRNFKQIAGRAGRRGFDIAGSVVGQAPEHVIENKRLEAKAAKASFGRRRKIVKRKPPEGSVTWSAKIFSALIEKPPEPLRSHFTLGHGLVVACLMSPVAEAAQGGGYRRLLDLIANSHEDATARRALVRRAAVLFRSLRDTEIIRVDRDPIRGGRVRVSEDLQRNFSLHQTLSLYLLDAVAALDPAAADYALDVLTLVEAILEDPRPILYQQQRSERARITALLKAQGVRYEERRTKTEDVTWPKPNAKFIYTTFNLFAERHPWVGAENIHPKSVAREMVEVYSSFADYVERRDIAPVEGLLLRYLSQVYSTLVQSIPEPARTDELYDVIAYLRSLVAGVDASLLAEWEDLVDPGAVQERRAEPTQPSPRVHDPLANPGAFRARIRTEMRLLVQALGTGDFEQAARCVRQKRDDPWDAARLQRALEPFFGEYEFLICDARARLAHLTVLVERDPRRWEVHQVLVDPLGDNLWNVEGEIDLREEAHPDSPLVAIRRIGT